MDGNFVHPTIILRGCSHAFRTFEDSLAYQRLNPWKIPMSKLEMKLEKSLLGKREVNILVDSDTVIFGLLSGVALCFS